MYDKAHVTVGPWDYHIGEDYAVVMGGEFDNTENPLARVYGPNGNVVIMAHSWQLWQAVSDCLRTFDEIKKTADLDWVETLCNQAILDLKETVGKTAMDCLEANR